MGGILGGKKQTTTSESTSNTKENSQTNPFTGNMLDRYNEYLSATAGNAQNQLSGLQGIINGGGGIDTSKLNSAWNAMSGMNNSNLNTLNTQSFNPNDNADWMASQNAINNNAMKGWGAIQDQINSNIIGSGMANGSGHQTSLYRAGQDFTSQLAADQAKRWQDQYNQNVNSSLEANKQLQGFYTTLANLGVDAANLSKSEIETLLNAYTQQNNALTQWGNAIEMGSNPSTTAESTTEATGTSTTKQSGGGLGSLLNAAGTIYGMTKK